MECRRKTSENTMQEELMQIISAHNRERLSVLNLRISKAKFTVFLGEKAEATPKCSGEHSLCLQLSSIQKVHFSQRTHDWVLFYLSNSDHKYELRTTRVNLSLHTYSTVWPLEVIMLPAHGLVYNFCELTSAQFILFVPFEHHKSYERLVVFHKLVIIIIVIFFFFEAHIIPV